MDRSESCPDTVLHNANVVTLDGRSSSAAVVAVHGGRVAWTGPVESLRKATGPGVELIDCQGGTLVPGFIDAHCHLLAYASSLSAADCRPSAVSTIADIQRAVRRRTATAAPGEWVRAFGYDELELAERRHPTRWELDEASPRNPVRLSHGSGHAVVLNSLGLEAVGISTSTLEPPGAVIERSTETGEPSGVLLEMDGYLDGRIPSLAEDELFRALGLAGERMLSRGITSVQDATAANSLDRWTLFGKIKERGIFGPRVTMMPGAAYLSDFTGQGIGFAHGDDLLNLGAAKIMLTATAGRLHPEVDAVWATVLEAQTEGFPVAIHAVEPQTVIAAAGAIAYARARGGPGATLRHRVEHCSECPPEAIEALAAAGAVVVTQPGFVYHRGRRYLAAVPPERRRWLYPVRSLREAGICVGSGSDAPVTEPDPLLAIWAAMRRRTRDGELVGGEQVVSVDEALRMSTIAAAVTSSQDADKGSIEAGKLADFALLDRDLLQVGADEIRDIRVMKTIVGGRAAWEA